MLHPTVSVGNFFAGISLNQQVDDILLDVRQEERHNMKGNRRTHVKHISENRAKNSKSEERDAATSALAKRSNLK